MLRADLIQIKQKIKKKNPSFKLTQGQWEAIFSLWYNAGDLTIVAPRACKALTDGDLKKAVHELFSEESGIIFIKKKKSNGLINRRRGEYEQLWTK